MVILRPTMQGRKGFDPRGYGPGVEAPFGYSPTYRGGEVKHHGQDYFWLGAESAQKLGISTANSKRVYPVIGGRVHAIDDAALGIGVWQQITPTHRAYSWHLSSRVASGVYGTGTPVGVMGSTGTAAGADDHLHFEVRVSPYGPANRVDPEPFFASVAPASVTPDTPQRRRNSMSTLYYTKDDKGHLWALAGDGQGSAAWLETRDQGLANALAVQHGNAAFLTPASFESWKGRYLAASPAVSTPPAAVDTKPIIDAIKALPAAIKAAIFR